MRVQSLRLYDNNNGYITLFTRSLHKYRQLQNFSALKNQNVLYKNVCHIQLIFRGNK